MVVDVGRGLLVSHRTTSIQVVHNYIAVILVVFTHVVQPS